MTVQGIINAACRPLSQQTPSVAVMTRCSCCTVWRELVPDAVCACFMLNLLAATHANAADRNLFV